MALPWLVTVMTCGWHWAVVVTVRFTTRLRSGRLTTRR
ncbi:hypothetical protein J2Y54_000266 [Sphingomonas sp. BE123]|jgi:hypothetical protein|nr:hypothetical protein [Sphingomonas sp. BE123]